MGNAKKTLPLLTQRLQKKDRNEWLERFAECDQLEYDKVIQEELNPTNEILTMGEVIHILNEKTGGDAIIVTDVGQHQMVACRYAEFVQYISSITSGGLGTMGFGLPAALGAVSVHLTAPWSACGRWWITNDHSRTCYHISDTSKGESTLLNNEFLGMVRQWQQLFSTNAILRLK